MKEYLSVNFALKIFKLIVANERRSGVSFVNVLVDKYMYVLYLNNFEFCADMVNVWRCLCSNRV